MKDETRAKLQGVVDDPAEGTERLEVIGENHLLNDTIKRTPIAVAEPPHIDELIPAGWKVVEVSADGVKKSLDNFDLNATKNTVYVVRGPVRAKKTQDIRQPGVMIIGFDDQASVDSDLRWKNPLLIFEKSAIGGAVRRLRVCGHDGGELVRLNDAEKFLMDDVHQFVHKEHKGGITLIVARSSRGLIVKGTTIERCARYGIYLGDTNNSDVTLLDLEFGPTRIVEDKKSSGLATADPNTLHGDNGTEQSWSEHCLRAYSVLRMLVQRCKFHNADNAGGKQCVKIMSGDGATFEDCLFDGSTRWGRDKNDPPGNTLRNVIIRRSVFTDWVRVDPGAKITIEDSTATARSTGNVWDMHGDARLKLTRTRAFYPGGKFSMLPGKIDTTAGGNFFNNKQVA